MRDSGRRLELGQKILVSTAPAVLSFVGLLSALAPLGAFFYSFYAVIVWSNFENVQPGWLTISLLLSFIAAFVGLALFGITTGIQRVIDLLSAEFTDDVVDEHSG